MSETKKSWFISPGAIVLYVIAGLIFICGSSFIATSNSLNHKEQTVEQATGNIQTALQRRADTIPNLVEAVKGSQGQESKVYGQIAEARTQYNKAQNDYKSANSQDAKTSAMEEQQKAMNIMVSSIHENYPDLKSNDQMSTLMAQIEGSNNRVAYQEQTYNDAVKDYNNKVVSFPASIVAGMTGHQKMNYFQADDNAQKNPTVSFGK